MANAYQDFGYGPLATPSTAGAMPAYSAKGALAVGGASTVLIQAPGANKSLLEYDDSQTAGVVPVTPATIFNRRNAWYDSTGSLVIDCANGTRQVIQLTNGVNAMTGFTNAVQGTTYVFEINQPGSGAAGTITVASAGNTIRANSLTLSPTNGKINYLIMTYRNTFFSAFVTGEF